MHARLILLLAALSLVAGLAGFPKAASSALGSPAAGPVEMAPPVEYPQTGIALAVPKGFEFAQPAEHTDILQAVMTEGGQPVQSVKLSAFTVEAETTAEAFAAERVRQLAGAIAVRDLEVLKQTEMTVAGITAVAQRMKYSFRGEPVQAAGVCFVRDLPLPGRKVCYLLAVECAEKQQDKLLPVLGEVVKSVSITAVRRPMEVPMGPKGPAIANQKAGYSFQPPVKWFATWLGEDLVTGQGDYLRPELGMDGLPLPQLRVIARPAPAGADGSPGGTPDLGSPAAGATGDSPRSEISSKECSDQCCRRLFEAMKAKAPEVEAKLLSEGPAKVAGRDAYQFVVLQAGPLEEPSVQAATTPVETRPASAAGRPVAALPMATLPAASLPASLPQAGRQAATDPSAGPQAGDPIIIAQRTVCVLAGGSAASPPPSGHAPGQAGRDTVYSLVLICPTADQKLAEAMLDELAEGFSLNRVEGLRPAATSAPASLPAGGRRTDLPASQQAGRSGGSPATGE